MRNVKREGVVQCSEEEGRKALETSICCGLRRHTFRPSRHHALSCVLSLHPARRDFDAKDGRCAYPPDGDDHGD